MGSIDKHTDVPIPDEQFPPDTPDAEPIDGEDQPLTEAIVAQVDLLADELRGRGHAVKWGIGRDCSGDRCVVFEVDGITEFHYPVSFFAGFVNVGLTVNAEHEANVIEADMVKAAEAVGAAAQLEAADGEAKGTEAADAEEHKGGVHLIDLINLCELYTSLGCFVQGELRQLVETGPGDQNPNACLKIIPWLKLVNLMFRCNDASFLVEDATGAIDEANYVIEAGKTEEKYGESVADDEWKEPRNVRKRNDHKQLSMEGQKDETTKGSQRDN